MKSSIILFILLFICITGCACRQDVQQCVTGEPDGFFMGLLNGLWSPFNFLAMLFDSENYTIYSTNNNGLAYGFGFIIGTGGFSKLLSLFIGEAKTTAKKIKNNPNNSNKS